MFFSLHQKKQLPHWTEISIFSSVLQLSDNFGKHCNPFATGGEDENNLSAQTSKLTLLKPFKHHKSRQKTWQKEKRDLQNMICYHNLPKKKRESKEGGKEGVVEK